MPYYRVTPIGTCAGQEIRNNFYYRLGVGIQPEALPFLGTKPLVEEWRQEVMPSFLNMLHESYQLVAIESDVVEQPLSPLLSMPYKEGVEATYGTSTGQSLGPSSAIWFKCNLEPMLRVEGLVSPKKGGMFVGPISESDVENGRLAFSWWDSPTSAARTFAQKAASNLESTDPPAIYYPVRLRQNKVLGHNVLVYHADILTWTPDPRLKMLKSRAYEK